VRNRVLVLLAIAGALTIYAVWRFATSSPEANALAYTECSLGGPPRVVVLPGIAAEDTLPVRLHEEVHAEQCRTLGPWSYRWKNLSGRGRLELEAPAYCAGARARLQQGQPAARVRERLMDDATAMFAGLVDSSQVRAALLSVCPDVARS
jgi:hypothetical protein